MFPICSIPLSKLPIFQSTKIFPERAREKRQAIATALFSLSAVGRPVRRRIISPFSSPDNNQGAIARRVRRNFSSPSTSPDANVQLAISRPVSRRIRSQ